MLKKIVLIVGFVVLANLAGAMGYYFLRTPDMAPPSSIRVEMTEARVARGKYLFENVCDCDGCHSERDFTRFAGPVVHDGRGKGFIFPPEFGLPGTVTAPNITPDIETGIGYWTDGEKIRAIREGIDREGRALFPFMPYPYYRQMSDEDVQSLVAFMNTLRPVKSRWPKTILNFPVNFLIKGEPQPAKNVPSTDRGNKLRYGGYLVKMAGCAICHSPMKNGELIESKRFAGGQVLRLPFASVVSANITPDPDTGIGKWTEQQFLDKFYQYRDYVEKGPPRVGPENFTLMPWLGLSQLPPEDLSAIYAFLKSQPAVYNSVEKRPEMTKTE
ncbi:MAG: cytochrome c [Acidobacteriia bacterium]|nr:cytochrome c [Terriglobia bacterium]